MRFKSGDKVWAISYPSNNIQMPASGEYPGVIKDFFESVEDGGETVEYYAVDIPTVPSSDGGWIISHRCLRPRDELEDPAGISDETPTKVVSWSEIPGWNPMKVTS